MPRDPSETPAFTEFTDFATHTEFERDPSLTRFWGVAENGDVYEVAVRPNLVDELILRWPAFGLERRTTPAEPVVGRVGLGTEVAIVPDLEESSDHPSGFVWDVIGQALTVFAAERLTDRIPVHAAVIERSGKVLVVPATSGAGKSTLTAAAVDAGATVLTDEYALIDPRTGLTSGWTRPVRIHMPDGEVDHRDIASPSPPLPVGLLAFLEFDADLTGHEPPHDWSPISPGQAVIELLEHVICARRRPDDAMDAALAVVRAAPAIQGRRGDAAAVIHQLLELVDQAEPPTV